MAAAKPAPKKTAPAKKSAAPAAAAPAKEKPAPKAKAEPKPKVEKIEQNGVTRPKDGTATGNVWAIADKLSASLKRPATRGEVMEKATEAQINEATVATQYQRWRVFNGVEKAAPKVKEPKPAKEPKAPKAKKTAAA